MSTALETRSLTRRTAWVMVVAVVALVLWGLIGGSHAPEPLADDVPQSQTDEGLYEAITDRMADGEGYYDAAIELQVERSYPTTPAPAVRTPALAWVVDAIGTTGARVLLGVLLVVSVPLMLQRFEEMTPHRLERYAAIALMIPASVAYLAPIGLWAHEAWALGLMLLSIAIRSDRRWWPAVVVGCLAPFFRELAIVYPLVMLLLSLRRDRREAVAWGTGVVLFVAFYAWHVQQVAAAQVPNPPASQGWLELGGWPFVVDATDYGTFVTLAPYLLMVVLTPLAVAGWWFVRSPVATRMVLTALAFMACFMVIGRPVNTYWGTLYGAMLIPGLAFVPRGTVEVWRVLTSSTRRSSA